jgi:hypothetical protein
VALATPSPLSDFMAGEPSQYFVQPKPKRGIKKPFLVAAFLLIPTLSTTLAGQITLGTGAIEFGQGAQTTAVCDSNITVAIASSYDSTDNIFEVSTITLGDLDTTVSGCSGKTITITALNSSGTALDLNGAGTTGNTLQYTVSGTSGTTQTRAISISAGVSVDSTAVARVLLETN